MDTTVVAALAAGSFAATMELAKRIGEMEFNALYHQGKGAHLFIYSVDENTIIVTVFNDQTTIGLVRFYAESAATDLGELLNKLRQKNASEKFELTSKDIEQAGKLF